MGRNWPTSLIGAGITVNGFRLYNAFKKISSRWRGEKFPSISRVSRVNDCRLNSVIVIYFADWISSKIAFQAIRLHSRYAMRGFKERDLIRSMMVNDSVYKTISRID